MHHDTALIATISVGLVLAFVAGFLARRIGLSPLVGYLLAGVAVGPFTPGFVADVGLSGQLAEIGVILLMFGVGLHFSLGDLMAVRAIAIPGALFQIATATGIGVGLALWWGWSLGAGVVFGLALSVASTVVLLRALEERGELESDNGRIAVGWLIVEDLAMVLTLVLLPALAEPLGGTADAVEGHAGPERGVALTLALTLGKVGLFGASILIVGRRVIPWLLIQVARTGSRELFTLAILAIALGVATGSAALFDVSFALGAFFAGVVLSESEFSHRAAADSLPLQDAFAVLFFVSVGMLFDPSILVEEPAHVLAVLLVIVLGKSLAAFALVVAFGHPARTALTIAASLAQIGEFSFILAGLGMTLNLLPEEGRDLILAGALLSITLNPLVFTGVRLLANRLERTHGAPASGPAPTDATRAGVAAGMRDHAVLVGCGRVGGPIARALEAFGLPHVVIERDRRLVESLHKRGVPAIAGDAAAPGVLAAAGIDRARLLVIAVPDDLHTRHIFELARTAQPGLDIVARTHSEAEHDHLEAHGVGLAVVAERELALGMMAYALRSLGLREGETRLYVQSFRKYDDGGEAAGPRAEQGAPELRPHRPREEAAPTSD